MTLGQQPLADRLRPQHLDQVVGQQHLLGEGMLLRQLVEAGHIPNLIFYGPPGCGKTTLAQLVSKELERMGQSKPLCFINATDAGVKEIRAVQEQAEASESGVLLYLDEIQNFNKKQQQSLLPYIESGKITLISSTTENPYFTIFHAILSRSTILEFKPLSADDLVNGLRQAIERLQAEDGLQIEASDEPLRYLAQCANGDMRRALTSLELALAMQGVKAKETGYVLTLEGVKQSTQTAGFSYDKFGDQHYDTLSAFQKSIRGSDANAAIHYLARLIEAGDLQSICRRLGVIAAEDIGLAYPQAVTIVKSCIDLAFQVGLPEARFVLAEATILLAQAPKSDSVTRAIDAALQDIRQGHVGEIPAHLKDGHYKGAKKMGRAVEYLYPHHYPNHYVQQQYLPDALVDRVYYQPDQNKTEQQFAQYQGSIRQPQTR